MQALDLADAEVEAWEDLRRAVAEHQGATLFDRVSAPASFDRVLGYPDERREFMAGMCR